MKTYELYKWYNKLFAGIVPNLKWYQKLMINLSLYLDIVTHRNKYEARFVLLSSLSKKGLK
jgi:hypothetical protein